MQKHHLLLIFTFLLFSAVVVVFSRNQYTVGASNFRDTKASMVPFVEKAHAFPSEPGTRTVLRLQEEQLVVSPRGPTYFRTGRVILHHEHSGKKFVYFDTGGGHLGTQGYVYARNGNKIEVLQVVFDNSEGHLVQKIDEDWFLYDSLED